MTYIKPLRAPKKPSTGKKKTILGMRREAVLTEYTEHAVEEHGWGTPPPTIQDIFACPLCAAFLNRLKESETWT